MSFIAIEERLVRLKNLRAVCLVMTGLLAGSFNPAQAAGDPERGALIFRECAPCHSLYREDRLGGGPTLRGVFGRQAGTVLGFDYSAALKRSGIIWTDETIAAWISDPVTFIPGSRKLGHTMYRDELIDDLLAYIKQAQGEAIP